MEMARVKTEMNKINVVMDYLIGGAYVGLKRIEAKLPEYEWKFSQEVEEDADILIYMNNHRHYQKAKKLGIKHIIQRKTGERSLKVQSPNDLDAVICASKKSFEHEKHPKKILIYNGIDFDHLSTIAPKEGVVWLVAESRIGIGQRVDLACKYARENKKPLTILGSKANLAENTYNILKNTYPEFNWVGTVAPDVALSYIKGCELLIVNNPSHGVANQIIEAVAMGKKIKAAPGLEIPDIKDIDINNTVIEYIKLFKSILT